MTLGGHVEQGVLQALMQLVQLPLKYCRLEFLDAAVLRSMHHTMRQAYHIIRLMCQHHGRNGVYAAAHFLPTMTAQMHALSRVRVSWGIAATLAAMFDDNKVPALLSLQSV